MGIFNVFLGLYVFPRRARLPSARLLIVYSLALALYSFGYAFELTSDSLEAIKLLNLFEYIGMLISVPVGLLIILRYLGLALSRALLTAVIVMPILTWIILATNDYHHFYYREFRLSDDLVSPHLVIRAAEWYIVFNSFVFCCWLIGLLLLVSRLRQTRRIYHAQLIALIFGQAAPMVVGVLYMFGFLKPGFDPIPIGMTVSSGLYVWAVLANRQVTVVPIAKETVFDSTEVGFFVLDSFDRLIDYNRTAGRLFPALQPSMIGRDFDPLWSELTGTAPSYRQIPSGSMDRVIWTTVNGLSACYQVRSSILKHRSGEEAGRLLALINVTEIKRLQTELEHQAYYDGLTQIYNRTHFVHLARQMLEQSARSGRPFTVVLFDIDYFKRVNDTFGHDMGDKVIRHVVSICRGMLDERMLFARYGGEEFVLALPSSDLAEGCRFAERLRIALEKAPLVTPQGTIPLTSSFGVAESTGDKEKLESLLGRADEALYESKRNGRNRVSA